MDYKEKYNAALERAETLIEKLESTHIKGFIYHIFPELKESKDEMIRKELIEHIKANKETDYVLFKKFSPDDVIAWLEKQVEKKPYEWHSEDEQNLNDALTYIDDKYLRKWLEYIIHCYV